MPYYELNHLGDWTTPIFHSKHRKARIARAKVKRNKARHSR